jgi:hypothetical protein
MLNVYLQHYKTKNPRLVSEGFNYFNVAVPPSKRTTTGLLIFLYTQNKEKSSFFISLV